MKNIGIFISSTFTDMQAERDYIKKRVIPQIQNHFRNYDINVYAIDLRWGVDTASVDFEEEREAKVLDVCFSTIRNSRPYFVGLLGSRYGWIPNKEYRDKVCSLFSEDEGFMNAYTEGRSVTEMEMLYGALGEKDLIPHSYFFFRSDSAYEQMPDNVRADYVDTEPERQNKLRQLKNKICTIFHQNDRDDCVFDYSPRYDPESVALTGFEEFGQKMIQALIDDITKECSNETSDYVHRKNDIYFKRKAGSCYGRKEIISELLAFIRGFDPLTINPINGYILCGESGCGKTTILGKIYSELVNSENDDKYILLTHVAGSTPESLKYWEMVDRWNHELEFKLKVHNEEEDIVIYFEKLLMYAVTNGYKPVVLIDAYDKFTTTDLRYRYLSGVSDMYALFTSLSFIPRFIPFICTSIKDFLNEDILHNNYLRIYDIEDYSYEDANEFIKSSLNGKELSPNAINLLLSKKKTDGKPSYSQPIWLKIAVALLDQIGKEEFSRITKDDNIRADRKIDDYILNFIDGFSSEPDELFRKFISQGSGYFSKDIILTTTSLLSISRFGISENSIEHFLGEKWDPLEFSYIIQWLGPFVEKEPISGNLIFAHDILKRSVENNNTSEARSIVRQYASSLLPNAYYDLNTLKDCFSIIIDIDDVGLFREVVGILDFWENVAGGEISIQIQKQGGFLCQVLKFADISKLSSIVAKSCVTFINNEDYLSELTSLFLQLYKEHESKSISDSEYRCFFRTLYDKLDMQVKIDLNLRYDLLRHIYEQCAACDGNTPLSDRYKLYYEYIQVAKQKFHKYGPERLLYVDIELFYHIIRDYIDLGLGVNYYKEDQYEYAIIMKHRLARVGREIDWLILLSAFTPEDVRRNGELLVEQLSSIVKRNEYFFKDNGIADMISDICEQINQICSTQPDPIKDIKDAEAQFRVGQHFYIKKSYQDAFHWLSKAAEQGSADAEYYIAMMYESGEGLEKSPEKAVMWYLKSAEHGHCISQNIIGFKYLEGIDVPKDYDLAMKWISLSSQQGYSRALQNMGEIYSFGYGADVDYEKAFDCYFKAALHCCTISQYVVGIMLMEGIGVEKDEEKALFWLHLAENAGQKLAIDYLEQYEPTRTESKQEINENHPVETNEKYPEFSTSSKDCKMLYSINYENLHTQYRGEHRLYINWSELYSDENVTSVEEITQAFIEELTQEQRVSNYIRTRKSRALKNNSDRDLEYQLALLSYYLENNKREDARRVAFEILELQFRFSFTDSSCDPITDFRLWIMNRKLYNSVEEILAIHEMLKSMENKFARTRCDNEVEESEGLIVYCQTKSERTQRSSNYVDAMYGYCDINGNVVIPFEYEYASFFYKGEALVCRKGQWYYINHSGEKVGDFYGLTLDAYKENETYGGAALQQRIQEIKAILENGPSDQKYRMAEILDDELNEPKLCAPIYEELAEAGHPGAQLSIGYMYYEDRGVEADLEKAVYWFSKGAAQGEERCKMWLNKISPESRRSS